MPIQTPHHHILDTGGYVLPVTLASCYNSLPLRVQPYWPLDNFWNELFVLPRPLCFPSAGSTQAQVFCVAGSYTSFLISDRPFLTTALTFILFVETALCQRVVIISNKYFNSSRISYNVFWSYLPESTLSELHTTL